MTQQTINLGTLPNDGTGDSFRVGGQKINANFTDLYGTKAASADLVSTAASKGASLVGVQDTGGYFTSITVEGALQEIGVSLGSKVLAADLASTLNSKGASLVGIEDTSSYFTSTTVEGALQEIGLDITNIQASLAGGYTISDVISTTYNLTSSDVSTIQSPLMLRFVTASAVAVNVPLNATTPIAVGSQINMRDVSTTSLTIVPEVGVTVNVPYLGTLVSLGNGSNLILIKVATNVWDLSGSTANA